MREKGIKRQVLKQLKNEFLNQRLVQVHTNNCPPSVRHTRGGLYPGCSSGFRPVRLPE